MNVSVILCTYNRSKSLALALESIAACEMPTSTDWRVLIVDNNSKDQTRAVAESFSSRYPARFQYLFESQQGKSHALNRGIREAQGEVVAFVDDDVTVEPDWLHALTQPFADDPQLAATGGRIYLPKNFTPPDWLKLDGPASLGGVLALFDLGPAPVPLTVAPIGTNMAYRKSVFEKYGLFRTDLGPRPGSDLRYEDTEFGGRLLAAGEKLLYVPGAIVHHDVAEPRLHKSYYLTYFYNYGRALVREGRERTSMGYLVGLGNRVLVHVPKRVRFWWKETDKGTRFFFKCLVWAMFGEIAEMASRVFSAGPRQNNLQAQPSKR